MSLYDDMRAVASGVLAEFKQGVIQYVGVSAAAGTSPDRRGTVARTPVTVNATASPVSSRYVDGTDIVQSDIEVTMANDGVVPKMGGYVKIDGVDYQIVQIWPRPAAGVPVTFTVIVRR